MKTPSDYALEQSILDSNCLESLKELLTELGGEWTHPDSDTTYIAMRHWFGSPIIYALKLENGIVYFRDAMYGSQSMPFTGVSKEWHRLNQQDAYPVYHILYYKVKSQEYGKEEHYSNQ